MGKGWIMVRIEAPLRRELEDIRRVYLKPHSGRKVPVVRDPRGRVSLSQVIARLAAERRRAMQRAARYRLMKRQKTKGKVADA